MYNWNIIRVLVRCTSGMSLEFYAGVQLECHLSFMLVNNWNVIRVLCWCTTGMSLEFYAGVQLECH